MTLAIEPKRRAKMLVKPIDALPGTNEAAGHHIIEDQLGNARRRRTKSQAKPSVSPLSKLPATSNNATGQASEDVATVSTVPAAVAELRELQTKRVAMMRMQIRIDNQCRSLIRRALGWRFDMPEKDRNRINKLAGVIVSAIQKGEAVPDEHAAVAESFAEICLTSQQARAPFDALRLACEKRMRELAKALPAAKWAEETPGFSLNGLAIIVGEAGDLSNYANPGKLWKRMGLAVFDGKAQRKSTDPELAMVMGYNPRRRSVLWTLGDSLLKATGPYRQVYLDRRAYECVKHPEFDKGIDPKTDKQKVTMHCHRRAQRYMEKRLLRDLWRAWRDAVNA